MNRVSEIAAGTIPWLIGFVGVCWLFWRCLARSDDPVKIHIKALFSLAVIIGEILFVRSSAKSGNIGPAFLVGGSFGVCALLLSIVWAPQISSFLVSLLANGVGGREFPRDPKPYYSIAIAKRKRQQPLEAVDIIRQHLAKYPEDFEGVMLLANIQADDLMDLSSAEFTVNHFCEGEQAPAEQVAAALAQLTDWRLKFYQEISSTKAGLQRIIEKYPGTPPALAARERIARLRDMEIASSLKAALQRMIDKYPGTGMARAARERIAQLEYAEKNLLAKTGQS